ncbi:hypothetical protein [Brevundimonas sp.]|uniref:hypothetical protein n=1 Tax=Brevundimonas sp. TaxID=1871086 RepID=UPI0035648E8A
MPVMIECDLERKRVLVTVEVGVRPPEFERAIEEALDRHPPSSEWDWIIDDHARVDDIGVEGVARIAGLYARHAPDPARESYTVIITGDRYFTPWGRVMDLHFRRRTHVAALTVEAAHALLDERADALVTP